MKRRLCAAPILATLALVATGPPALAASTAPTSPGATLCVFIPPVYAFGNQVTPPIGVCIPWP